MLYIHIPFCDSKCYYCAFNSYVDKFNLKKDYMVALKKQLLFELKRFNIKKKSIKTVFFGGGTPSTILADDYREIFLLLNEYLVDDAEITLEANPNSASKEWLEGMFNLGANRISFGVQTFNSEKLKFLNRAHTSQLAKDAILNANKIGFKHISLDLIYATIKDNKELLQKDLDEAFKLPIDHLSAYALTIEQNTPFENKTNITNDNINLTKWLFKEIENRGFKQYEISNFGKYSSKHNIGYWEYKDYMGVGSGAVGKLKNKRFYPTTNLNDYIANPLDIKEEILSLDDTHLEKIFLGFRSFVGVLKDELTKDELKKAYLLTDEKN
jgi:oxygen-independent coproporphyrinogen-3 oxidase